MTALALESAAPPATRPRIPQRIKVLYVTTLHRSSNWLAEAFASDNATRVTLRETVGVTAGLALLRDEAFDAVVVFHEPGVLDALEFVEALRTGGHEEPMIVLGIEPPQTFEALAYEVGADAYCSMKQTTTRCLLWEFARAIRRFEMVRENRRLMEAQRQQLESEHAEAERLLAEQKLLLADLESIDMGEPCGSQDIAAAFGRRGPSVAVQDASLVRHYRELLETYVMMGSGNLAAEMTCLVESLVDARVSAHQVMQLHVEVLEAMIHGLGRRSARHVMNRADLLVLELAVHLADGYRQLEVERRHRSDQRLLPGFDEADLYSPSRNESA